MATRQQVVLPGAASAVAFQNKARSLVLQPNFPLSIGFSTENGTFYSSTTQHSVTAFILPHIPTVGKHEKNKTDSD